jgi:hypothetical protein
LSDLRYYFSSEVMSMSAETLQKQADIERAHEKLREMARRQGVKPITSFDNMPDDLWPENEGVDDFLNWVRDIRQSDSPGRNAE